VQINISCSRCSANSSSQTIQKDRYNPEVIRILLQWRGFIEVLCLKISNNRRTLLTLIINYPCRSFGLEEFFKEKYCVFSLSKIKE